MEKVRPRLFPIQFSAMSCAGEWTTTGARAQWFALRARRRGAGRRSLGSQNADLG
jgi:hypothetical protein